MSGFESNQTVDPLSGPADQAINLILEHVEVNRCVKPYLQIRRFFMSLDYQGSIWRAVAKISAIDLSFRNIKLGK